MATNEELEQRIKELESLVISQYDPPSGPEYSFPVPGRPIDQDQFRLLSLGGGNGILDRGGRPYWLRKWPSDAETNQKNSMLLTVSTTTKEASAQVSGYFHRLTEDMEINLPAVAEETTYYVCLTFDPRYINEEGENSPKAVSVQCYDSEPPLTFGRIQVLLHTVTRKPNQLLTEATIVNRRPKVAPTIQADTREQLPTSQSVLWGTIAFVDTGSQGAEILRAGGPGDELGGPTEWLSLTAPDWVESTSSAFPWAGHGEKPAYRVVGDRVELRGRVKRDTGANFNTGVEYTLISNCPDAGATSLMHAGADQKKNPVRIDATKGSSGKPKFTFKEPAAWADLTGLFYYRK